MARILICEPVDETRELLERLVHRMGHDIVGTDQVDVADVVIFEPGSAAALAFATGLFARRPSARLIACSAAPPERAPALPGIVASLQQPFSPRDLARALAACDS